MIEFFLHLFDPSEPPTSTRDGPLSSANGWFHLASDMSIFFAYAVLCTLLMIFLYRQRHLPHRPTIWMIWLFMLACGVTRLVGAAMLYYPAFRLLLVVKVVTAIICLVTVFAVARIFPSILEFDFGARSGRRAGEEDERHRQAADTFAAQRDKLEQRATNLTVRDRRLRRALESSGAAACCWDSATNDIVWEVGLKTLMAIPGEDEQPVSAWGQLLSASECDTLLAASKEACATGHELSVDLPVVRTDGTEGKLIVRGRCETSAAIDSSGKANLTGTVSFFPAGVPA